MSTTQRTIATRTWGLLVLLSLVWGGSFLFGRIAVAEVPPLTLTLARVALAALTLNVLLIFVPGSPGAGARWQDYALMGLLNNVIPFSLIFYGQQEIGAGLAAIVNAMTPIWTVLIAHAATSDEKLSANRVAGVVVAFAGVGMMIGAAALAGFEASAFAQLSVLGATLSYGVASVFGRRFANNPPVRTARGQLTASTAIMLPLALLVERSWTLAVPSASTVAAIVVLAVVCTALAYVMFFQILASAGATAASLVTFLIPPSAIALGIVFQGEVLEGRHIIGCALILAGLALVDGRTLRWLRPAVKSAD